MPLPAIIHSDLSMRAVPFPYLVLERLPGTDLGHVYPQLSAAQKRALACAVVDAQRRLDALPDGAGFGFAASYDAPFPHPSWPAAVEAMLRRSESRIVRNRVADPAVVSRVRQAGEVFAPYLAAVRPRPFLHDTTTKNVIVDQGRLTGIVDVDDLCFGDGLHTAALTRMALLMHGWDTSYIDCWMDAVQATEEQRRALSFYTAEVCVDFIGELGHHFSNRPDPAPVDPDQLARLLRLLDGLLAEIEQRH